MLLHFFLHILHWLFSILMLTDDLGSMLMMLEIYLSVVFGDIVKLVRSYVDLGLIKARLLFMFAIVLQWSNSFSYFLF